MSKIPCKEPACDQCKSSRVRCLPRTDNAQACPRCVDKDILCSTTPVQRGRPRKDQAIRPVKPPAVATLRVKPRRLTLNEDGSTNRLPPSPHATLCDAESLLGTLACRTQLTIELFDTFCDLPQAIHVSRPVAELSSLVRASSPLELLSSPQRVLLHAILAIGALSSPAVVSVEDMVSLHQKSAVELNGLDLRSFGRIRRPAFESLRDTAYNLAKDEQITVDCSDVNAASCMLMNYLESRAAKRKPSRPYASAYMSHLRCLRDEEAGESPELSTSHWMVAVLRNEALDAVVSGRPCLVTTQDFVSFCGASECDFQPYLQDVRNDWRGQPKLFFDCLMPYGFSVVKLAKESYKLFTSAQSHSQPLDEKAIYAYLAALSDLRASLEVCQAHGTLTLLSLPPSHPFERHVNSLLFSFSTSLATLYLPIYREIVRRSSTSTSSDSYAFNAAATLVRRETLLAAMTVSQCVRDVFALTLLTHVSWACTEEWTQIMINEMEASRGMGLDVSPNLGWMVQGLKLAGWSNVHQDRTIDMAEQQLSMEAAKVTGLASGWQS